MKRLRVIPVLSILDSKLVKTTKFKKAKYIGDPLNAIKIFNDKEVDELIITDIRASKNGVEPNFNLIAAMSAECFMPLAYGGGVSTFEQAQKLFKLGIEKLVLNTALHSNPNLIRQISEHYGSQSVVVSMDIRTSVFGKRQLFVKSGTVKVKHSISSYIEYVEELGAGEIFVNNIDRDGTFLGFDVELVKSLTIRSKLPIIGCGGLDCINNILDLFNNAHANAAAGGAFFIYANNNPNSILITYPKQEVLIDKVFRKLK